MPLGNKNIDTFDGAGNLISSVPVADNPSTVEVLGQIVQALGRLTLDEVNILRAKFGLPLRTEAQLLDAVKDLVLGQPWTIGDPAVLSSKEQREAMGVDIQYARVTGANATTTGQALMDIPGLTIPLLPNAVYEIEAVLSVATSNVTTGCQYGVQFSAAGASIEAGISGTSTATANKSERINALNAATSAYLTASNLNGQVVIKGGVSTGANGGDLTIRHLKVTSGTSTVRIGSHLRATRVA